MHRPWLSHYNEAYGEAWSRFVLRSLRMVGVCYASVAVAAYNTFPCQHVLGAQLMEHDLEAACGSQRHNALRCLGALVVAGYVVGFPLGICVLLWSQKKRYNGLHVPHLLARYGTFYEGYRGIGGGVESFPRRASSMSVLRAASSSGVVERRVRSPRKYHPQAPCSRTSSASRR